MPLQETSGNATADAYGGGVAAVPNYIEDVFSTYLYTGTGATRTITNGINLSTKGGMVWFKNRNTASYNHCLFDTLSGATKYLRSNSTGVQATDANTLTAFNTTGFNLGSDSSGAGVNQGTSNTYVSWTFRKQPKFFDVVTWTGDGTSNRSIPHNLGVIPGATISRPYSSSSNWCFSHVALSGKGMFLNLTDAAAYTTSIAPVDAFTSTDFNVTGSSNTSGETYIAYLYASDSGGFGLTGTDNVITCGSYTGTGATGNAVTLGFEPQWILVKDSTNTYSWQIQDVMRGMSQTNANILYPDSASAEVAINPAIVPTATGFRLNTTNVTLNNSGDTYIYIAIRRGPMKVPTSGTTVFDANAYSGTGTNSRTISSSVVPDSIFYTYRNTTSSKNFYSRLQGNGNGLPSNGTSAEYGLSTVYGPQFNSIQTGYVQGTGDSALGGMNASGYTFIDYLFKRAPSFFDVVCYSGTGSATTVAHNLGVAPELIIVKRRNSSQDWFVYSKTLGNNSNLNFNLTSSVNTPTTLWNTTTPTSSVFSIGSGISSSGSTYIAYLFATCPKVSKVFSYTGNDSTQTINCGFTSGARFVFIKSTNNPGAWYVFDTARGMVSGTDPSFQFENNGGEATNTSACITETTGFTVDAGSGAGVNNSGYTYIGIAIA